MIIHDIIKREFEAPDERNENHKVDDALHSLSNREKRDNTQPVNFWHMLTLQFVNLLKAEWRIGRIIKGKKARALQNLLVVKSEKTKCKSIACYSSINM